jgi:hypothetical protein
MNTKHLIVTAATAIGLFMGVWVFNNIHAWSGIAICVGILVLSINYIINQIKKS